MLTCMYGQLWSNDISMFRPYHHLLLTMYHFKPACDQSHYSVHSDTFEWNGMESRAPIFAVHFTIQKVLHEQEALSTLSQIQIKSP